MTDTIQHGTTRAAAADPTTASPTDFLFNHRNLAHYRDSLHSGIELVQRKTAGATRPFTGIQPRELAPDFAGIDLDQALSGTEAALAELERLYLDDAVYFHHPRYLAHLNCPVVVPALLAEQILTAINSSLDTWDQSVGGTLIEQKLIDWTLGKIGLGPEADGIFTSGGTQSNLMALLLARDNHCARKQQGHDNKLHGLPANAGKFRIFTSAASHFSVQKSAAILGLGYQAVVSIPCDADFRMDTLELEREINACLAGGLIPIAVVATAGTTDFGSLDPLEDIAAICRSYDLWLHADAAYGCGLLVSSRHRQLLKGIEYADSVTVDYHKSFFQPVSCGAFFVKDKRQLAVVTHHADYLNPLSQLREGTPNLVNKSIQTTRRFDALKLWLTLRTMGAARIGEAFDQLLALTRDAHRLLARRPGFELLHKPTLSTLVFRYVPAGADPDQLDRINAEIRKAIFRSGEAVIAATKVEGRQYLKLTLLNPATTLADIDAVATLIAHHGEALAQPEPCQPRLATEIPA
ncbi:pyridoxal-dependent decarboxylase [Zobellella denitrificans]|uniref:pyridoxal phosphate-dependent decarboxylase family protein n=1 Tax=Zobellella denitrificans TaxID=347534 RepID=UPI000B8BB744|nr:aspartate aminotransferase family protein [Zobellella denitrificans]OXS15422.1 pyridoxal-dependent decarboxylase [Zobellella denitrificans]